MAMQPLDAVAVEDLTALIEGGVRENATIDFKRELPRSSEEDTPKLLALVCALANTAGGRVYYGIDERSGAASALTPLGDVDPDAEERRLAQMLQTGIEPVVPGVRFHWIESDEHGRFMVLDVPRSWAGPHMVRLKRGYRMYSRVGPQNVPLDATRMRRAFSNAEELPERIRRWRLARLDQIVGNETPAPIDAGPLLVLHIMPLASFDDEYRIPTIELNKHDNSGSLSPLAGTSMDQRINIDGVVRWTPPNRGYCQAYRSGRIESVLCGPWTHESRIASVAYERYVLSATCRQVGLLRRFGMQGPISIMLSLDRAHGLTMAISERLILEPQPIDRPQVLIGEMLAEEGPIDWFAALRPAFDAVWNACGLERSYNYDKSGKWIAGPVEGLLAPS